MIQVYETTKFLNAETQFVIVGRGFILLRVVCWPGGGVIMTATAGDGHGLPVFPRHRALVAALWQTLDNLGGLGAEMQVRHDRRQRIFGEVVDRGSIDTFLEAAACLARQMCFILGLGTAKPDRQVSSTHGSKPENDLQELYDVICHADGAPAYLSDGVCLNADGRLSAH